jgi:hypothetical protein
MYVNVKYGKSIRQILNMNGPLTSRTESQTAMHSTKKFCEKSKINADKDKYLSYALPQSEAKSLA